MGPSTALALAIDSAAGEGGFEHDGTAAIDFRDAPAAALDRMASSMAARW